MDTKTNRQFLIAARPDGMLKESDFQYHEAAIPELDDGQVLVNVKMVAVEPALRGTMVEDPNNPANPMGNFNVSSYAYGHRIVESIRWFWESIVEHF